MYKLVKYDNKYKESWNAFIKANYGSPFHSVEWMEVLEEAFGYKNLYHMAIDDKGEIAGVLPLVEGRDLFMRKAAVSLPFVNHLDICCRESAVFDFLVFEANKLCKSLGLRYVELRLKGRGEIYGQNDSNSSPGLSEDIDLKVKATVNTHNYVLVLPLDRDEEQVLKQSTGSNRNHVRKVYKNGYFSSSFDKDRLEQFYNVYTTTMKRLGSPSPSYKFFQLVFEKLPEAAELLTVTDNETGRVIGGMTLFHSGDTLQYLWGGSYTEYNKKYVNSFMYWEAVRYAISKGYKYMDFGRSPFESGTYRYKLQWGAVPLNLKYCKIGNRENAAEVNSEKLSLFVSAWKIIPKFVTDIAGNILIKHVMP